MNAPQGPPGRAAEGDAAARGRAWEALAGVPDPEIPALTVLELGIVRGIEFGAGGLAVTLTPTYSGCPATEWIEAEVRSALQAAGFPAVQIRRQWSPAWSSDWISEAGREKLRAAGIAPPGPAQTAEGALQPLRFVPRGLSCPRCTSRQVEQLSAFGATACKSLYRCLECREPFEHFKPI